MEAGLNRRGFDPPFTSNDASQAKEHLNLSNTVLSFVNVVAAARMRCLDREEITCSAVERKRSSGLEIRCGKSDSFQILDLEGWGCP